MIQQTGAGLAGRSVFVTGHTGFKGAWLSLWLARIGARVTGYALAPPTSPSLFEAADVREMLARHHEADIRDRATLYRAIAEAQPEVIFHLAAQTRVLEGYRDPVETVSVNVLGTSILLDVVRELAQPCAVVAVSSDKCYENDGSGQPFAESHAFGGADPYSASKGAMELIVAAFRRSFFDPEDTNLPRIWVATARAGNVIGGGDWTRDAVMPDAFRALTSGLPVYLRYPHAVRPWQHVLEPLHGYLLLAEQLLHSGRADLCSGWNFGPSETDDAPVSELVGRFISAWGSGSWLVDPARPEYHEAVCLRLSSERARVLLGWRPRWDLGEAILRTASWYRGFATDPSSARELCLGDLAAFEAAGVSPPTPPIPD